MPLGNGNVLFHDADRRLLRWILGVVVVSAIVTAFVMLSFNKQIDSIQTQQDAAKERGYIQRAISCQILGSQVPKDDLPDDCYLKAVTKYYDPENLPLTRSEIAANRNAVIYCGFLKEQGSAIATQEPCRTLLG